MYLIVIRREKELAMSEYMDKFIGINRTVEYDKETALSLAIACDLAYKDAAVVKNTVKNWGYQNIEFIEKKKGKDIDTQCFVMSDDNDICIVFRGTDKLKDWLTNFQTVYDPGPLDIESKVHEGFQDALFPSVIELTKCIDQFKTNHQKIWVTGHSLGGALCSLYAGMLIENGYPVYGIYTFASPRAGDNTFATKLNEAVEGPHYRVVNTADIVPHVPPEPFYTHTGMRRILKENEVDDKKESWWDERIKALKKFIDTIGQTFDVIDNHTLTGDSESYIPRLFKDVERSN